MSIVSLVAGALLAGAVWALPIVAFAEQLDPMLAGLTEGDLGPGFTLDELHSGRSDLGPVALYSAVYRRDPSAGAETPFAQPSASIVGYLVSISRVGPLAGLLEGGLTGMPGAAEAAPEATPVSGPLVGERTYWYRFSQADDDGVRYEGYAVGFSQKNGAAILFTLGNEGQSSVEETADWANVVAIRLAI
ncbi:MAG: hypothetical protein EXR58_03315 [Chloroflexi bacterium]|nr:hypothetical protein [Chloroflexota bacterium]